jgi:hypothetical protein
VNPFKVKEVAELMREKSEEGAIRKESVASILESDATITIERWLARARITEEFTDLAITDEKRTEYLPEIIKDIVVRLRKVRTIEMIGVRSSGAVAHGRLRFRQGYTAPMIVEEARLLELSLYETIQRNLARLDFGAVIPDIMLIADEVDSQLTQTIDSFLKDAAGRAVA